MIMILILIVQILKLLKCVKLGNLVDGKHLYDQNCLMNWLHHDQPKDVYIKDRGERTEKKYTIDFNVFILYEMYMLLLLLLSLYNCESK